MWTGIASLLIAVFKWIFGGKQQAEGEAQGKAEQALDDINQEMLNEQKAQAARQRAALSSGIVSDPDNLGPVSRR